MFFNAIILCQQVYDPINYIDTEILKDRPRAPPPMEQRVQYNEVLPGNQTNNPQDQQLDNSEYSRLNTRGYHSPHQPGFACNDAKNNETYSTIAPSQKNSLVNTGKERCGTYEYNKKSCDSLVL